MDDTFVIQQMANKQVFLDHIYSIDAGIQLTIKGNQENQAIPFLDTLVNPRQIIPFPLQFTTNCPILTSTYSGTVTIIWLLSTVSLVPLTIGPKQFTTPELLNEELEHLREVLVRLQIPQVGHNLSTQ